jgi:DNA polymerase-3 subunit beta
MKALQDDLALALRLIARLIRGQSLLPELMMVRLTAAGQRLQLMAISEHGQSGLKLDIAVNVDTDEMFDLLVPARHLSELVDAASHGENVELRPVKNRLRVSWARNTATLTTLEPGVAHTLPEFRAEQTVIFNADELRAAIPQVSFAAAKDQARPILTGICLEAIDSRATLAAANGVHLMSRVIPARCESALRVVLPAKFCADLLMLLSSLDSPDDDMTLSVSGQRVTAEYGDALLWAQLLEGQYPDVRAVMNQAVAARAVVSQLALGRLARAASVINPHTTALQLRPNLVALYAADPECGDAHPVAAAQCVDTLTTFVNPQYISPAIKAMPKGDLEIRVAGPKQPVMLSPNPDTLYVLMPLAVDARAEIPEPEMDLFHLSGAEPEPGHAGIVTDNDLAEVAAASYSAVQITEKQKIRKPFLWNGEPYVAVALQGKQAECVKLVPREQWQGEVTDKARGNGYAGVGVTYGKTHYVMTDVWLTVIPEPETT